jgi:hypothetical protein
VLRSRRPSDRDGSPECRSKCSDLLVAQIELNADLERFGHAVFDVSADKFELVVAERIPDRCLVIQEI